MNLSRICLIYSYSSFVGSFSDFKEKWNKFCQLLFRLLDKFEKEGNLATSISIFQIFILKTYMFIGKLIFLAFQNVFPHLGTIISF